MVVGWLVSLHQALSAGRTLGLGKEESLPRSWHLKGPAPSLVPLPDSLAFCASLLTLLHKHNLGGKKEGAYRNANYANTDRGSTYRLLELWPMVVCRNTHSSMLDNDDRSVADCFSDGGTLGRLDSSPRALAWAKHSCQDWGMMN